MAPGSDQATISRNIDELTHHGSRPRSHAQIVAIALSNADKHPGHAFGGGIGSPHKVDILPQPKIAAFHPPKIITPSQGTPFWTRSAAHEMDQPVKTKFAKGGGIGHMADGGYSSADDPWFERSEARAIVDQPMHSGLIPGAGAGRTDRLPLAVGSNSHIVPADAVSGAGQGNTANGVAAWQAAIHGGPYGVPLPKEVHGHGPPSPPHVSTAQLGFAAGGEHHEKTPILAAPGEMVIAPEEVETIGARGIRDGRGKRGESAMDAGHRLIDEAIAHIREFNIKWLQSAPPPKKSIGGAVVAV